MTIPISYPSSSQDDLDVQRRRLEWLAGLRWYAAASVVLAELVGEYVFGLHIPMLPLFGVAVAMFLYNAYYVQKLRHPTFSPAIALHQMVLDVISLTLVLFFTGGFLNPFFTFYFFLVILAAIILPPRQSIFIAILITLGFALQGLSPKVIPVDMKLSSDGWIYLGEINFHVIGAPLSFVITTALTAYFTSVIMGDLRKREREVRAARQQAELELIKLDNLLDRLEAGMLVLDRHQRVERVNDRLLNWFGSEGSQEGDACYLISKFARLWKADPEQENLTPVYQEARLPTLSLGVRDFEVIVNPIRNGRGQMTQLVTLILDITEQKKNQAQWAQTQKLAAIGQLAAGVAHEINTPLGTINILAEEARDMLGEIPSIRQYPHAEELEDSLETIHQQIRRCKEITQSLLNFSRKTERTIESCAINDLILQALELVRHRMNGIRIVRELDPNLPPVRTDVHGVERAIFNLLVNAADAVEENPGEKSIEVATAQQNGMIVIRVQDNGAGIDEKNRAHIFEPFFTTKAVGRGTGLGLYVTYGTIRDLGGEMEFESQVGEGTRAVIRLPMAS